LFTLRTYSHNIELMLHILIRSGLVQKQVRRHLGQDAGNEHLLLLPMRTVSKTVVARGVELDWGT
jgi:hypothetical protein